GASCAVSARSLTCRPGGRHSGTSRAMLLRMDAGAGRDLPPFADVAADALAHRRGRAGLAFHALRRERRFAVGRTENFVHLAIERRGGRAVLAFKARRTGPIRDNRHETVASTAALRRTLASMPRPPTHVVHLWALDETASRLSARDLTRARRIAVEEMTALARALADQPVKPRLWVVTAGGVDLAGKPDCVASMLHAGMTGFLRS